MAQVTVNIKDSLYAKEVDAVASMFGWTDIITDAEGVEIPNPVTKEQFFKQQIKTWARNQAIEYANRQALASVVVEEE